MVMCHWIVTHEDFGRCGSKIEDVVDPRNMSICFSMLWVEALRGVVAA